MTDQDKQEMWMWASEFATQNFWASISPVFNRILQSEIEDSPEDRYKSTNSPKSKTRNALICRHAYTNKETGVVDIDAWEHDLLTSDYYGLSTK
ncbi:MAG: hypothetical protein WCI80_05710 [Bacteroidota bacterium]